jgi:hypothetical protein
MSMSVFSTLYLVWAIGHDIVFKAVIYDVAVLLIITLDIRDIEDLFHYTGEHRISRLLDLRGQCYDTM